MEMVKAIVVGDIPAYRLLWLIKSEDGETMRIKLPSKGGTPVDFVSTSPLKDGQEVTITVTGNPVWKVEAGEKVAPGDNVYADEDGRIIVHNSTYLHSIGYVLDAGEKGDIVRMVRNYKFVDSKQVQAQTLSQQTKTQTLSQQTKEKEKSTRKKASE